MRIKSHIRKKGLGMVKKKKRNITKTATTTREKLSQLIRLLNCTWFIFRWAFRKHGMYTLINIHAFNSIEMLFMHLIIPSPDGNSVWVCSWCGMLVKSDSCTRINPSFYIPVEIPASKSSSESQREIRNNRNARLKFNWQNGICWRTDNPFHCWINVNDGQINL